jgi:PPOX class probable F420-dependent enzyme
MLDDAARTLFATKTFASLAVVDDDGMPHVTPVWIDVDDDGELWFNTAEGRFKDRYLGQGAPVSLAATNPENPYEFVMVRGTVKERRLDTAEDDIDALAKKYMGLDSYPLRKDGEVRVTVVVDPTSTVHYGG